MRTRMYGGVRGRKTKVGGKLLLFSSYSIVSAGLVNEDIPSEYILDLTSLDSLDIVVELE